MAERESAAAAEVATKLASIRGALARHALAGVRLRGVDWFAWASGGGSSAVILTAETGVAEVLVTARGAWLLTDVIEAARIAAEENPAGLPVEAVPWQELGQREAFVREMTGGGPLASDRPAPGEQPLPPELMAAKRRLLPAEVARYRLLGREAAAAVTAALTAARPDWTEHDLAGEAARALWQRGIHPTLTLVAGERRLPVHRHATATAERLGARAMLVVCGRRNGLYANLTRFVAFRPESAAEQRLGAAVAAVEAATWEASRPGSTLGAVYEAIVRAYAVAGYPGGESAHHQGGTTGYLSRELVALPGMATVIEAETALAWNPSLPGAKIEDTVITSAAGIEILTVDPAWPVVTVAGRPRPAVLVQDV